MKSNWRIWNSINPFLRGSKIKTYLEIGGDGRVCRMVKGKTELVYNGDEMLIGINPDFALKVWSVNIEDFFSIYGWEKNYFYAVILLRDWDEETLANRVESCHDMLVDNGVLIIENFNANKNELWRISGGLKRQGIKIEVVRERFLFVYKNQPLTGSIRLRIRLSTFTKNPKKYLP